MRVARRPAFAKKLLSNIMLDDLDKELEKRDTNLSDTLILCARRLIRERRSRAELY